MDLSLEHYRAYVFLELQRNRKPSQIFAQLQVTGVVDIPSQSTVFLWCKRFKEGTVQEQRCVMLLALVVPHLRALTHPLQLLKTRYSLSRASPRSSCQTC